MNDEIPPSQRCARCHRDLWVHIDKGGCTCCRSHSNGGRKVPIRNQSPFHYEAWDGWGYYEHNKYVLDHEEDK